jgi:hypothetical protein
MPRVLRLAGVPAALLAAGLLVAARGTPAPSGAGARVRPAPAARAAAAKPRPRTDTVRVTFICKDFPQGSGVSPDPVRIAPRDTVAWVLDPRSDVTSFSIEAKDNADWPYADGPRHAGRRDRAAKARRMKPTVQPDSARRYRYNVTATCGGRQRVIDPDLIIRLAAAEE